VIESVGEETEGPPAEIIKGETRQTIAKANEKWK
jgi:hypothetical protein